MYALVILSVWPAAELDVRRARQFDNVLPVREVIVLGYNNLVDNEKVLVKNEHLRDLCRRYQVASLKVFGSVARGEEREDSDIDILVRFVQPVSLLTLVRMEREMSALLGRKVDLVTEQGISLYIRDAVLASARGIYELS